VTFVDSASGAKGAGAASRSAKRALAVATGSKRDNLGSAASRHASKITARSSPSPVTSVRSFTAPPGKGSQRFTCTSPSAVTGRPAFSAAA